MVIFSRILKKALTKVVPLKIFWVRKNVVVVKKRRIFNVFFFKPEIESDIRFGTVFFQITSICTSFAFRRRDDNFYRKSGRNSTISSPFFHIFPSLKWTPKLSNKYENFEIIGGLKKMKIVKSYENIYAKILLILELLSLPGLKTDALGWTWNANRFFNKYIFRRI